jgi:hypothetical protein
LINQFSKNNPNGNKIELTKESFERTVDVSGNLAGRGQLMSGSNARGSQGTPQQPSKALIPPNNKSRKTPTGGKKAFQ